MTSCSFIVVLVIAIWSSSSDGRPRSSSDSLEKRQAIGCGQTGFYSNEGFIQTPNYPDGYGDNMNCLYTIQPNSTIQYVNFYTCVCDIEDSLPTCHYDYIEFGSRKTCGLQNRQHYSVSPNNTSKVEVNFRSDGSVTRTGCNVAYGVNMPSSRVAENCPVPASTTASSINTTVSWNGTTPSWNGTTPSWTGTTSSWNGTTLSWNGTTPSWNGTTPSWNGTTPSWNGTTPSWNGTTPSWNVTTVPTNQTNYIQDVRNSQTRMYAAWNDYMNKAWAAIYHFQQN